MLILAGVLAGIGAIPYILQVFAEKLASRESLSMHGPVLFITQGMQLTLVLGIVVGVGLLVAPSVGIRTPLLHAWLYREPEPQRTTFGLSIIAGVVLGLVNTFGVYFFMAHRVPDWPSEAAVPIWMRLGVSLYSGIDEELLVRLFLLAVVLWFLQKLRGRKELPNTTVFWIANVIVTILFVLSYFPATSLLVPLTSLVVLTIVFVKGISGLVFGYLCWKRGLEAAIVAHFLCDLIAHLLGPAIGG